MTLTMTLSQTDLMAAIQTWVASQPGNHQMDMTTSPTFNGSSGAVTVKLNQ